MPYDCLIHYAHICYYKLNKGKMLISATKVKKQNETIYNTTGNFERRKIKHKSIVNGLQVD